ncbi:MAG: PQQ-binding-like beta-propeller repeat protein [Candidatus Sumerlaeota bacterium]|nr:PQQ-binding-like beta-propeller repeat protein [Candidatus Sumerlaeota bacterium]
MKAWRFSLACVVSVFLATLGGAAPVSAPDAKQILEAAGLKGGLIAHIGCGPSASSGQAGQLTAALHAGDCYVVHGLDADPKNVDAARKRIQSLGLYGPVSVDLLEGNRLPYIDNLVNLVVSENLGAVSMHEVMRVLAPNGVAYVQKDGAWAKTVKPRPKEIDDWTHYLYNSTNNAVSHDTAVGPVRRLQWVGSPAWARHHDHMASMSALVSANGRLFYIMDEGPRSSVQLPPKWTLVARDAFSGVILWKRPIDTWYPHLWPAKSGHAELPRRLVAVGDRVYVTLGIDAPLSALDAATGATIRTYDATKTTEEILESDGVLYLQVNPRPSRWNEYQPKFTYVWDNTSFATGEWAWDGLPRHVMAVKADTGKTLWSQDFPVAPLSLTVDAQRVYFYDGKKIVGLDRGTGQTVWSSEPVPCNNPIRTCFGPTLLAYKDTVLFSGGTGMEFALDAATGKSLWDAKHPKSGHASPEDLMVIQGLVWAGAIANGSDSGIFTGRDPRTGEVKSEFPPDVKPSWFHHRCYRNKATDNYVVAGRTGIEFIDLKNQHWDINHWVRGGCLYGTMPANGLVYSPPNSCACYLESKLNGFNALAPESSTYPIPKQVSDEGPLNGFDGLTAGGFDGLTAGGLGAGRLEKGPAFDQIENPKSQIENGADWPTYRHDNARSGGTAIPVSAQLKPAWEAKLGGKLSAVTIAGGKLFVASIDTHTVYALDENSGQVAWSYTTGGRVDSPPTLFEGRALFGSHDGYVYCLRAADGALAWRFRAAPEDRRLMSFEQLESVWPVPGSILVQNGVAYCVAGRSMFLDGGMRLLKLDPRTGAKLAEVILDDRDPNSGKPLQLDMKGTTMPVALPDVLSSDGQFIYMRSQRFTLDGERLDIGPREATDQQGEGAHLFTPTGFLDDSWWHRTYWMFGRTMSSGWGRWFTAGRMTPSGRLLVFDGSTVFGFGRKPQFLVNGDVLEYQLYAADKAVTEDAIKRVASVDRQLDQKKNVAAAAAGGRNLSQADLEEDDPPAARPAAAKAAGSAKAPGAAKAGGPAKAAAKAGAPNGGKRPAGSGQAGLRPAPAAGDSKAPRRRGKNYAAGDWAAREALPLDERSAANFQWRDESPPLMARAMVLAGKMLFIAGPPDIIDEEDVVKHPNDAEVKAKLAAQADAMDGKMGSSLWAVSTADGTKLGEVKLESVPVFDSMAFANGRLFMALADGRVVCLGN